MKSASGPDQKVWQRIEALFELRESLKKDFSKGNRYWQTVKIEEVESILYGELAPQVRAIVYGLARGSAPEDVLKEITNEAIYKMFNSYPSFRGRSPLKSYFASITKNVAIDCLRKIGKERDLFGHGDEELERAADEWAVREFREKEKTECATEAVLRVTDSIFELIDFQEQSLTDKEFVTVLVKLAALHMKKKPTDEELARKLGMKRTAFLEMFRRGKEKIYRYWKDKLKDEYESDEA